MLISQVFFFFGLLARTLLKGTVVPRIGLAVVAWWIFRCAGSALVSLATSFLSSGSDPAADAVAAVAVVSAASNAAAADSGMTGKRAGLWALLAQGASRATDLGASVAATAVEAAASTGLKLGRATVTLIAGLSPV